MNWDWVVPVVGLILSGLLFGAGLSFAWHLVKARFEK